ncbi:MAG: beta-1,6-N-acetylglucosaminyltransferase [Muribaculaceae bacterium]|nr:beta-1,6-N-acetylglucosaminyltransferase [Muribaculaceae bacterium]
MKHLCYIIMAHSHLDNVARNIRLLSGDNVSFLVHVDAKCTESSAHLRAMPGVRLSDTSHDVGWGDYSMVNASMSLCSEALALYPQADYFILLSGHCVPLKSSEYIKQYISSHGDANFLRAVPIPSRECGWPEGGRRRLDCYAIRLAPRRIATIEPRQLNIGNLRQIAKAMVFGKLPVMRRVLDVFLRAPHRRPFSIQPYGGAFWWRVNRPTLQRAVDYFYSHPEFRQQLEYTSNPDEVVFNTLVYNLGGAPRQSILTFENWKGGNSPEWLTAADKELIAGLIADPDVLFCRKVSDTALIDYIASSLDGEAQKA